MKGQMAIAIADAIGKIIPLSVLAIITCIQIDESICERHLFTEDKLSLHLGSFDRFPALHLAPEHARDAPLDAFQGQVRGVAVLRLVARRKKLVRSFFS